eukprot:SAG31_NODE_1357_length_8647_cov_8.257838_3_plen_64_part_00
MLMHVVKYADLALWEVGVPPKHLAIRSTDELVPVEPILDQSALLSRQSECVSREWQYNDAARA